VTSAPPVPDSPAARFITTVRWADLPEAVTGRAVLCLVDTVAAMLAGRPAQSARIAAGLAGAWWGPGDAHLLLDGRRVAAPGAGFANAVAANAVDIDDVGIYTWGHPGAQVVPAALALAEQHHLHGRDLLTAIVVGYEIAFRAGRCVNFEASKVAAAQRTYRACGSWGSVACAAIASHVLGLDQAATRHARDRRVPLARPAADARPGRPGDGQARHRPRRGDRLPGRRVGQPRVHRHRGQPRPGRVRGVRRRPGDRLPAAARDHLEAVFQLRVDASGPARGGVAAGQAQDPARYDQ
jgi:hypothetical protein